MQTARTVFAAIPQGTLHAEPRLMTPVNVPARTTGLQFVPFVSDRIVWRGYSTRLGPNAERSIDPPH